MSRFSYIAMLCLFLSLELHAGILVVHSQSATTPSCPTEGSRVLWTGYSFLGYVLESGHRAPQKLGSPGSCLREYIPLPMTECQVGNCDYDTGADEALWLNTARYSDEGVSADRNWQLAHVSRCAVCETPHETLVRHSFTSSVPSCPNGWSNAWDGYTFAGGNTYYRQDMGQDLGDTGSCLPQFVPDPTLKCYFPSPYCDSGFWFHAWGTSLTNYSDQSLKWHSGVVTSNNGRISRCRVCVKEVVQ